MGPVRARIQSFLACRRLAFVGVSRDPEHFSRFVLSELSRREFDVVPVNGRAEQIAGLPAVARVSDIAPPVEWALIMTPRTETLGAVEDCHRAGIRNIWLHHGSGEGAVSPEAIAYAERHGLELVPGECPLMFLEHCGFVHRFHALCKQVAGTYPT